MLFFVFNDKKALENAKKWSAEPVNIHTPVISWHYQPLNRYYGSSSYVERRAVSTPCL